MSSAKIRMYLTGLHLHCGELVRLNDDQHYYLSKVMRVKVGEKISVFNGVEGEWAGKVESISKREITLVIAEQVKSQEPASKLTLFFSPVKAVTASWIVQKATELRVTDIYPVITERTIVNKVNGNKLIASAIEAAEQSERLSVPVIHSEINLKDLLKVKNFAGALLFCDERADIDKHILKSLSNLKNDDNGLLIGPEGGFSNDEKEFLYSQKFVIPVSLGKGILRAETAIISALSMYQGAKDSRR